MLENYSQTMVKAYGRPAFGCYENIICYPLIPLAQKHGCDSLGKDEWSGPAVPPAVAWHQEIPQSTSFKATYRIQLGWFDSVWIYG